jgi:hypothetical protein
LFKGPGAAAFLATMGATSVMAEIPSPTLIGVQRVVIACEAATGLSQAEREALCKQLVKKADVLTDLPVSLASAADLDPTNLSHQADQLLLRVAASVSPVAAGRKTVTLIVTPVRAAVAVAPMPGLTSSVSLLKVRGDWVLQGPVDAFTKLLGSGPHRLHKPVRSDM